MILLACCDCGPLHSSRVAVKLMNQKWKRFFSLFPRDSGHSEMSLIKKYIQKNNTVCTGQSIFSVSFWPTLVHCYALWKHTAIRQSVSHRTAIFPGLLSSMTVVLSNSWCDLELLPTLHNPFFPCNSRMMGNTHKPIVYWSAAYVAESKNAGSFSMKTKKCCQLVFNQHTVDC